jgi:hypothetical protein
MDIHGNRVDRVLVSRVPVRSGEASTGSPDNSEE